MTERTEREQPTRRGSGAEGHEGMTKGAQP
jgi:hypothetical protein